MHALAQSLNKNPSNIVNLNLSYNSLTFRENQMEQFFHSEDFLEQFCEYLEQTKSLVHIDLSGLNFEKEQLEAICPLLGKVTSLIGIHLSDMGIKRNPEDPDNDLMLEILDYFGIDDSYSKEPKAIMN